MAEEYYDFDREARRRASLAEESLNEQLLGLTRAVARSVISLREVFDALIVGDEAKLKDLHTRLERIKEQAESMKEDALSYMARLGDILAVGSLYRTMFIMLTRIAQVSEGVAYRAYVASTNSAIRSDTVKELLLKLADALRREYELLENAIQTLRSNPKKSYEDAQMIESIEDEIDEMYRKLAYTLYHELSKDIVSLMLMKDITEMVEDIADYIRDVGEEVKFLALRETSRG